MRFLRRRYGEEASVSTLNGLHLLRRRLWGSGIGRSNSLDPGPGWRFWRMCTAFCTLWLQEPTSLANRHYVDNVLEKSHELDVLIDAFDDVEETLRHVTCTSTVMDGQIILLEFVILDWTN